MPKLFELLTETAQTHKRTGLLGFCYMRVNAAGKTTVTVNDKVVAAGNNEGEIIVGLTEHLVSQPKARAEEINAGE